MYLDTLGLVTAAIGDLCDDVRVAQAMPFVRPDGKPASTAEVAAEHAIVKAAFCGVPGSGVACAWKGTAKACLAHQGWRAAMKITKLRLTPEGVKAVVLRQLDANDFAMRRRFLHFEEWPWQAQLATHSMAWACGTAFRFPRLEAALNADDFRRAARECEINADGPDRIRGTADDNAGVRPRNAKNVELYLAAVGQGLDASPFDVQTTAGVQGTLARLGYDPGPIDGKPGPKTTAAVKAFQRDHNLHDDGIVGPKTSLELVTALRTAA
jgi:hypothetical protein